jgi:transposase-like protein
VFTGDFGEALAALVGPDCPGLSASTVVRLKQTWEAGYRQWARRDLADQRYDYLWADGVHFNVQLEGDRTCIFVLIGATPEYWKELITVQDGYRESEQSLMSLLLKFKQRGLTVDPELATGVGAMGFWKALPHVYPRTRTQRCWDHKTANVLDKLPKRRQPEAKDKLHQIWMAPKRQDAREAFDHFVAVYELKYLKAAACLASDRDALLTLYDFPAEHWVHIRTTNPIESTFATVRLRIAKTKG